MKPYRSRKYRTREPLKHLVIVCEGEDTEVTYFSHYKNRRYSGVRIEVRSDRGNDPVGLVKYALKRITDSKDPLDMAKGDRIWCVFDADNHNQEELEKAIGMARPNIELALSVPCFELWFILHFRMHTTRLNADDTCHILEKLIPGYFKGMDIFDLILQSRDTAMINSDRLKSRSSRFRPHIDNNPSTMVHLLVEEIIEILNKNRQHLD